MKQLAILLLILALILAIAGCTAATTTTTSTVETSTTTSAAMTAGSSSSESEAPASYIDVTPMEAQDLIANEPDLVIIDVSPVYDNGHLPGAVNYYVGDGSLDEALSMLDQDKPYLVYCHTDSASILGAQKMVDAGFSRVYRLEGNYSAWVDAGYEIEQ